VSDDELTAERIAAITATVDIEAPPPPGQPTAHLIFGTNQALPATIVAQRYHQGLAPLVIVTGGVNRHNGIVEGQEFLRLLTAGGVPASAIRCEDRSADTWQNIEFALPHLREAIAAGLSLTAVSKWYHLRAVHVLRTLLPELDCFHALSWEPVYSGAAITRQNWPDTDERRKKVIRERDDVARKVGDGTYLPATIVDGAWR
jgi:hypothetical protein